MMRPLHPTWQPRGACLTLVLLAVLGACSYARTAHEENASEKLDANWNALQEVHASMARAADFLGLRSDGDNNVVRARPACLL